MADLRRGIGNRSFLLNATPGGPARWLVMALAVCMLANACTTTREIPVRDLPLAQGERLQQGTRVSILLMDGSRVRGRVVSGTDAGLTVAPKPASPERFIPFTSMQSLEIPRVSALRTALAVVGGALVAVITYAILVLPYRDCGGRGQQCVS